MIHRSLVEEIGYPLVEYFIWFDDSEYCMRFKRKTQIIVQPAAFLVHKVKIGTGIVQAVNWKEYYDVRNQIDMYRRHHYYLNFARKIVTSVFKGLLAKNGQKRKMYFKAIRDGWMGKLGKNDIYCP